MGDNYILDGKTPVRCEDIIEWAKKFDIKTRRVASDSIGDIDVSTVFLGIDHNWGGGPPLLFETMVFGGKFDQEQERYATWKQAEEGHKKMVEKVKRSNKCKKVA